MKALGAFWWPSSGVWTEPRYMMEENVPDYYNPLLQHTLWLHPFLFLLLDLGRVPFHILEAWITRNLKHQQKLIPSSMSWLCRQVWDEESKGAATDHLGVRGMACQASETLLWVTCLLRHIRSPPLGTGPTELAPTFVYVCQGPVGFYLHVTYEGLTLSFCFWKQMLFFL